MILTGKNVYITGANRGIGEAFAKQCAIEKTNLFLVIRNVDENLKSELLKLGAVSVQFIEADLSNQPEVDQLCEKLKFTQIDVFFNNAGLLTGGLLEDQKISDIQKMLQVNVNALIQLTHAVLPQMLKQKSGKIINHGSVSSIMHLPCASTYSAAKAAVWAFTDCLEQELKGTGVSTLCLLTPGIRTRMFAQIDEMYSKNVKVPKDALSPDVYAEKILNAVKNDQTVLWPSGINGVGLLLAQHCRSFFNWSARLVFKR